MHKWDLLIISYLNGFARKSWTFDTLVVFVSGNNLLKAGLITGMLWWAWFHPNQKLDSNRESVIAAITLSFVAIFFARILARCLPFKVRPISNPELGFQLPFGVKPETLWELNSFPSDHAVMFFALSTVLLFISNRLGITALLFSFFVICLPRVYLGFHYPTNILAGALIGTLLGSFGWVSAIRKRLAYFPMEWVRCYPGIFYAGFFLITFEMTSMFKDVRRPAMLALEYAARLFDSSIPGSQ